MNKLLIYSFIIVICVMMYFYFIKKKKTREINQNIPNAINIIILDNSRLKYYEMTKNALEQYTDIKIVEWTYEKCLFFLKNNLNPIYKKTFDSLNIFKDKIFFISLCILYKYGGWIAGVGLENIQGNIFYDLDKKKENNFVFFINSKKKMKSMILGAPAGNIIIKQILNDINNATKYKNYYSISTVLNYLDIDLAHGYHRINNATAIIVTNNNLEIASVNKEWLLDKQTEKKLNTLIIQKLNYYSSINIKKKKVIPKILHITGPENIPVEILIKFKNIIAVNRDFKILYYDDIDSRNIIKKNFDYKYLNVYDKFNPTAYKADFFRYSVMYVQGGVYGDLSQEYYRNLKDLVNFNVDDLVLCDDLMSSVHHKKGIQISFLASVPGLNIYKILLDTICDNVNTSYYGKTPLDITGPILFKEILDKTDVNYIIKLRQVSDNDIVDENNLKVISRKNSNHAKFLYKNSKHYSEIWSEKKVYKKYQTNFLNMNGILEFCNKIYSPNFSDLNNLDIVALHVNDIRSLLLYLGKHKIKIVAFINNKTGKFIMKNIIELIESSYVIRVYCTNCFGDYEENEKLKAVPLGLNYNSSFNAYLFEDEHTLFPSSSTSTLASIPSLSDNRLNRTLSYFNLSKTFTKSENKQNAYIELQYAQFNDFLPSDKNTRLAKINEIKKYKYIICPSTYNTVDISSIYKIIALGSIPVVLKSPLDLIYKKIKVIRLKTWKDISLELLDKKYTKIQNRNNEIMTMEYWKTLLFEDVVLHKKIKEYNINNI